MVQRVQERGNALELFVDGGIVPSFSYMRQNERFGFGEIKAHDDDFLFTVRGDGWCPETEVPNASSQIVQTSDAFANS